jgi:hypothetical protein
MSALFCMIDDYQSHLCWSVDGDSGLLGRVIRLAMAVSHSLLGCPASCAVVFCCVEDVEHILQGHDKALGLGFGDQLFQLGVPLLRPPRRSPGLAPLGMFTTSLLL